MAKVKIQGHASGTGILTVTAPNTSTDRTITLPDATGTLATTADITSLAGIDDQSSSNDDQITIYDSAVVFNEDSDDLDFRIEDTGGTHAFFLQGSEGRIGINHSTPDARLEIHPENETGLLVQSSVAGEVTTILKGAGTGAVNILRCDNSSETVLEVLQDGRGLSQFTAKAWLDFRGTTNVIHDSHNISSVTDESTGTFLANFSNNMANANHCGVAATQGSSTNTGKSVAVTDSAVGSRRFETYESDSATDPFRLSYIGFGD